MHNLLSRNSSRIDTSLILFKGLGFFSTSSILAIIIGGRIISLFTIFLFACFIYLIFNNKGCGYNPIKKISLLYSVWIIISIISSLFGFLFFIGNPNWQSASLEFLPKLILYYVLFLLLARAHCGPQYCEYILKGVFWGIIINIIAAFVDAFLFYSTGFSIINEFFHHYIEAGDVHYEMISLVMGGVIRSCGFNLDPANIGMFVIILTAFALFEKKYILLFLSFLGILASLSHTALLGALLVFIYYVFANGIKIRHVVFLCMIIILLVLVYENINIEELEAMQDALVERTVNKSDGSELQGARGQYWLNFIPAVFYTPSALFIGMGYGTASYPYLVNGLTDHIFMPYDPEQTYFSTYFDVGLCGFIVFVSLYITIFKKIRKMKKKLDSLHLSIIAAGILGTMIAFLGYHYTIYSVAMLLLISSVIICDNKTICINKTC